MIRVIFSFIFSIIPVLAFCADQNSPDNDVMQEYNCVYKSFFIQIPQAKSIDKSQEFTKDGIQKISSLMDESVRLALKKAAARAYKSIKASSSTSEGINPEVYFDLYLDELQKELPKHINFSQCLNVGDLNGVVYDVAVNHYISSIIGNGVIHQWFIENGGTYAQSAFVATMVSIEISGHKLDLEAWKRYYKSYVLKKFETPNSGESN